MHIHTISMSFRWVGMIEMVRTISIQVNDAKKGFVLWGDFQRQYAHQGVPGNGNAFFDSPSPVAVRRAICDISSATIE